MALQHNFETCIGVELVFMNWTNNSKYNDVWFFLVTFVSALIEFSPDFM